MFLLNLNYLIFYYLIFGTKHVCYCSHFSIELHEPNQYKGIVIAFSTEIPANEASNIIAKTQDLIIKASEELYRATGKRAYFNEVNFVVPKTWSQYVSAIEESKIRYKYSEADVIINANTDVQSFTFQYAGCGKHSLPIVLSKELVLANNGNNNYGNTEKLFVHEWAHYRYGVFNEFGFPEDNMYPLYYSIPGKQSDNTSNIIQITSCADSQQEFKRIDKEMNGNDCQPNTNVESGLPAAKSCVPLPDVTSNTFKSSYMYQQAVNSVQHFCGSSSEHKHNSNAPNKQNVLCNGRDTWSVISDHPDMKKAKEDNSHPQTKFKYSLDPTPNHTLIASMNSDILKNNKRWEWIDIALRKLIKFDLPSDSVLKFFEFQGNNTKLIYDDWVKPNVISTVPLSEGTQSSNDFSKILESADQAFSDIFSGTFIIVIGGHGITHSNNIETIANKLREKRIKLKIIVYPYFYPTVLKNAMEIFDKVLGITGGSLYFIKEDTNVNVNTLHNLFEAFENSLVDYAGGDIQKQYTLKTQTFRDPKNSISFNFSIDSTIKTKLYVYLIQTYTTPYGMINLNQVTVRNPDNNTVGNKLDINDRINNIVGYSVNQSLTSGLWTVYANLYNYNGIPQDSIIAVAKYHSNSLISNEREVKTAITANCWLNSDTGIHTINSSNHLAIYVQLNKNLNNVVQNAEITVEILNESGNSVGNVFNLTDDGSGDPDITAGDGIYSQYITNIESEGIYYIKAYLLSKKDNGLNIVNKFGSTSLPTKHSTDAKFCCGSKISGEKVESIDNNFVRQLDCGSVYIFLKDPISYPPNSIRNLRMNYTDISSRTVDLVWTAPGGYLTSGIVKNYVIKAFVGKEDDPDLRNKIIADFDSKNGANLEITEIVPENYGMEQKASVKIVSDEGGVYYFAIKSFNNNGIGSSVSNIAIAYIGNVEKPSTTAFPNDVSKEKVAVPKHTAKIAGMDWWIFMIILIACVLILVFVIIFIICFIGKRRRKNEDQPTYRIDPPQRRAPEPPRISPQLSKNSSINIENGSLTHSIDKISDKNPLFTNNNINKNTNNNTNNNNNAGSEPSIRELNVNTLSPVQSWDAKDLLSHWGRVQEAKQKRETPPVMRIEDIEVNSTPSHRSLSYASSDDDNSATYSRPATWRYQNLNAKPTYIPSGYPEPALRGSIDPMRSNTPSDSVPRYSTVNRRPNTTAVSQV